MAASKAAVAVSFEQNGIAIVRMQRRENRVNMEFVNDFHHCLDTIEKSPSCRGVVTTGEGKFYSNGLDLDWLATADSKTISDFLERLYELTKRLLTFSLPTVAAINGHCYAAGAILALCHDFRVMNSERGWLCFNEVFINKRFGPFFLKLIESKISPQAMHRALVFGQRFTGPEAVSAGVVDKAVVASLVLQDSRRFLLSWIDKYKYSQESLQMMKMDVYEAVVKEAQMQSKL